MLFSAPLSSYFVFSISALLSIHIITQGLTLPTCHFSKGHKICRTSPEVLFNYKLIKPESIKKLDPPLNEVLMGVNEGENV